MKRMTLFIGWIAICQFNSVQSQHSLGIQAGASFSNVDVHGVGSLIPNTDHITRPFFHVTYQLPLYVGLSFRTGLAYQQKGFLFRVQDDVNIFNLNVPVGVTLITEADYLTVPVELMYTFNNRSAVQPYITAGLTGSYEMAARVRERAHFLVDINVEKQELELTRSLYNRWELGAKVGLGVEFDLPVGNIFLEAGYQRAFTNMLNDPILAMRLYNQNFNVGAGYSFRF